MILAGDIGGTKTNLALFAVEGGRVELQEKYQFASREFSSLEEVIIEFEKHTSKVPIDAACFGIAGPLIDGRCRTTNLAWDVTTSGLQKHLNTDRVRLLNDLEATAYGMLYLEEDEFVTLNPTGKGRNANRAVIAAGTGLGEAMLFWDGMQYHPIGSEGGHSDFAPLDAQQDKLLQWLRLRYPEHLSYERILSGPGISTLYEFLAQSGFAPQPSSLMNIPEGADRSARISECALEENDPLCRETLQLFARIYGAEAGNLALKTMSLGGVYIGGGIAPKILPFMTDIHFMDAFTAKGRFKELLQGMEVKISLNPETALFGAARFAADKL
ncbi:MAG: glucokinase [Sulfuricurvum sp.]|jgi:glucokinase|uniref:glucokinase n=1 Tax=Sulfuricurvum sp. TaxID=2025608 RepID=UPI0025CE03B7|nr:glucokinase [Sulfuricurvum sp.]MCK9372189.1 glucokinase [Sulfuricurvum sp.]